MGTLDFDMVVLRDLDGPLDPVSCELTRRVLSDTDLQATFDRRGYVVVDLLTPAEVDRLVEMYSTAADAPEGVNPPGAYNDTYAEFTVIHSRPDFRRAAFEAIDGVLAPRAAEHLVDYRSLLGQFVNKPPGTGVVPAHQNWSVVDEARYQSVSVWTALVDCSTENGTLLVADGSHRRLRGRRGMWAYAAFAGIDEAVVESMLTPVEVRAGQAVILDDALVHYSAPNRSDQRRLAIQYVMVPTESEAIFCQQVDSDGTRLDVDVWHVEPAFFFDFWHGDGDPQHGEVVARITVDDPSYDATALQRLLMDNEEHR